MRVSTRLRVTVGIVRTGFSFYVLQQVGFGIDAPPELELVPHLQELVIC